MNTRKFLKYKMTDIQINTLIEIMMARIKPDREVSKARTQEVLTAVLKSQIHSAKYPP